MTVNQTNGSQFTAADVRGMGKIHQVYTGTGFDSAVTSISSTDTANVELTAIPVTDLGNADYILISIRCLCENIGESDSFSGDADTRIKIETKDIGGNYSETLPITRIGSAPSQEKTVGSAGILNTIDWIHVLSNDEKTNGVQVKITSEVETNGEAQGASVVNKQTVISGGFA